MKYVCTVCQWVYDEEKEGILDIKLILNQNRKINIEMQNTYQDDWTERSLFYNCRMFTDGLKKGHPYGEIPPCIHVGILNFNQISIGEDIKCICLIS